MNYRLWISTLLLGILVMVAVQLSPFLPFHQEEQHISRSLQQFNFDPALEADEQADTQALENILFRNEGEGFEYPPCQKTNVEQQRWTNFPAVERVFLETYSQQHAPNVDMVVSLCRENFQKVKNFAKQLKVKSLYIYSKCGQSIDLPPDFVEQFESVDVTILPNVGREGHSFLTHMLREDVDPTRWSIFFQGQIERDMHQAMLSLVAAHEHDVADDGTTFINMYRVRDVFCKPIYVVPNEFHGFWHASSLPRYQSHRGTHKYLDIIGKQLLYRGEFVAKNSLFGSLDREKILEIKKRLEVGNNPWEGQYLERFWVGVLGASDNCRCEGTPLNNLPMTKNLTLKKPTQQSSTVGKLVADNAVDGKNMTAGGVLRVGNSYSSAKPQDGQDTSWWVVDLTTIALIRKVTIYLPPCCKDSLDNSVLDILDVDQKVLISRPVIHNETERVSFDSELVVSLYFKDSEGRFVRITKSDGKNLSIAQVQVAGFARNLKFPSPFIAKAPPVQEVTDNWMDQLMQ